jgi:cytochrome bd-type quinol oxidase subunit 2
VNPFYVLAGIDVAIFFTTFILLFVNIKPNYDRSSCDYPLAAFLVITYLEVNFLQVIILVAHGFEKSRIYIWIFTVIFVPTMLVFTVVGNVWVSKEDRQQSASPNACVSYSIEFC